MEKSDIKFQICSRFNQKCKKVTLLSSRRDIGKRRGQNKKNKNNRKGQKLNHNKKFQKSEIWVLRRSNR